MAKIREKHEADLGDQGRSVGKTAETEEMLRAGFGLTSSQELTVGVRFGYSNSDTTLDMSDLPNSGDQGGGQVFGATAGRRRRTALSEENE